MLDNPWLLLMGDGAARHGELSSPEKEAPTGMPGEDLGVRA